MPLQHLKTKICIDCICLPMCLNKTRYDLISNCQLLRNDIWDTTAHIDKYYTMHENQIGLDLVNIGGTNMQVIIEKHRNKTGAYQTYARMGHNAYGAEVKLRISKITKMVDVYDCTM